MIYTLHNKQNVIENAWNQTTIPSTSSDFSIQKTYPKKIQTPLKNTKECIAIKEELFMALTSLPVRQEYDAGGWLEILQDLSGRWMSWGLLKIGRMKGF